MENLLQSKTLNTSLTSWFSFDEQILSTKIENGNDGAGNVISNYIVSVSMSKRYLFSYYEDADTQKEYVNIIDIQNERVMS